MNKKGHAEEEMECIESKILISKAVIKPIGKYAKERQDQLKGVNMRDQLRSLKLRECIKSRCCTIYKLETTILKGTCQFNNRESVGKR